MQKTIDRQEIYRRVLKGDAIKKIAKDNDIKEGHINALIMDIYSRKEIVPKSDLEKARGLEAELFRRIEKEQMTGKYDAGINNLSYIYSTFNAKFNN